MSTLANTHSRPVRFRYTEHSPTCWTVEFAELGWWTASWSNLSYLHGMRSVTAKFSGFAAAKEAAVQFKELCDRHWETSL